MHTDHEHFAGLVRHRPGVELDPYRRRWIGNTVRCVTLWAFYKFQWNSTLVLINSTEYLWSTPYSQPKMRDFRTWDKISVENGFQIAYPPIFGWFWKFEFTTSKRSQVPLRIRPILWYSGRRAAECNIFLSSLLEYRRRISRWTDRKIVFLVLSCCQARLICGYHLTMFWLVTHCQWVYFWWIPRHFRFYEWTLSFGSNRSEWYYTIGDQRLTQT